ncbi:amidohydrolase family protein [Xanthomonadaceae bacterium XH05]|nr:amidohydrolase family protein [Xanthomonadaceae bacterium XH05]
MRLPLLPIALSLAVALSPALAAPKKKEADAGKWDVGTALPVATTAKFTTDEGTWMDLDVSPDGRRIAFSLLGDLYLLPIEGGNAQRITSGPAWDIQPRFSPDGKQLAFTSDRDGGNNLWRIGVDGKNPVQVTKERFRLLNNPAWTPDGQYLIGRKHFTGRRSLGAGELWMYHVSGGDGLQLTKQKNDQQDLGEPALSPDGRYVYFSEDVTPGPMFQYNKNPHDTIYSIKRLDRQNGQIDTVVDSAGGAVRPQPSPDGKHLAFVKRVREKSVLHLMELESGHVRPLWDGLSHDQQEAWAIFGPYSNYNWLPDASALVIWAQGGIWRVDAEKGEATKIPFQAQVEQALAAPLRFEQKLEEGSFAPQMIRDVATSPDGKTVVFHALGHLYTRALPNGRPQRLTASTGVSEYQPSFSPDGRKLLYTRWSDAELVQIIERDLASGSERTITTQPGFYYGPTHSPDARHIVYSRTGGGGMTGAMWSGERGVYVVPAQGGTPRRVAANGSQPQFSSDGARVLYFTGGGGSKKLMSVGLNGEDPREVLDLKYPNLVSLSPDGKWVAFTELFNAYVAPMPQTGGSIALSKDSKAIPVTQVSQDAGSYLHWAADSKSLHWVVGDEYFSRDLKDLFAFVPGAPKDLPKPESAKGVKLGLSASVDTPKDTVAFTNARIITMRDAQNTQEVIENGTVLVVGDEIRAVGENITIPAGARVIDAAGKTIVPGYADVHAHVAHFGGGVVPQQNWAYYANLAFGITTTHDPSATTELVFSQAELVRAGVLVGPRIFSTGTILYGADGDFKAVINSADDARSHLRRMQANGAFSVKSYNQPRRDQRQQVNQAARELGMLVVEEGGSTFHHNMTMILDGATTIEHNLPIAPLYRDVIELWRHTDVRNTPTLVVSYGGLSGEYWWYARDEVWLDGKLARFFPRETLDARSIRRETAPDWDYYHIEVARAKKALRDAGVKIQVGGHGQLQGLSPHWEAWSLVQGGFTNWEALRAFTIDGVDSIGFGKQLGSLEAGKKADLVVLNSNPLDDIRATADTRYVMVNGRLFDVDADMAEIGNRAVPAPTFYWQRHQDAHGYGVEYGPTMPCHCPKSGVPHRH